MPVPDGPTVQALIDVARQFGAVVDKAIEYMVGWNEMAADGFKLGDKFKDLTEEAKEAVLRGTGEDGATDRLTSWQELADGGPGEPSSTPPMSA